MAPIKFVIKCGNFAVLVDLHVLPLGPQESADWFAATRTQEVAALVRDAVEQRVKLYAELLHDRKRPKQRKELPPAPAFSVRGENFNLMANFLKRHSSLRCVVQQDLRLFPERYVVCVSCPEDALANHRNPSLAAAEPREQTRSEYFSSVGGTHGFLHCPTKTKKPALQKTAKQGSVQGKISGSTLEGEQMDQEARPENQAEESESSSKTVPRSEPKATSCCSSSSEIQTPKPEAELEIYKSGKRCEPGDDGEDPRLQPAKRTRLGRPPATTRARSAEGSSQTSIHDLPPSLPLPPVQVNTGSMASHVSVCKKTTLEVELLTPGKRAQRLPLASNNTAPTIQNRPAASLRGLSVKPASSGSSIGSRSALGEEGSENVPRTSRLRRTKRS
ncbi:protein SLX4IP isoform X2 [Kryptolebias marmoratus]|uniref:SLX4 interacting protein n=2 Tax=Kryptolebias marmoratus TaxID=37003 RepID=A0A3Q3A3S8_KRYMA|nr:protein SLX4IP isoform X2 [Kryptolebias marmoratus]XP_024866467.1 protein SLX4IP isoform X2 [Kryptolebias marmoratus]XP_037829334.1 protein SLX4IP isoform X2 [Kryptolebias marmoratus]XP_037829335.1 protein SLX4IP isoform X2 [Kryptolebias marmoratus]